MSWWPNILKPSIGPAVRSVEADIASSNRDNGILALTNFLGGKTIHAFRNLFIYKYEATFSSTPVFIYPMLVGVPCPQGLGFHKSAINAQQHTAIAPSK